MTADVLVLQSMANLQHNKDFIRLRAFVSDCLAEQTALCLRESDEVYLRRAQGAASALDDFLKTCDGAHEVLEQRHEDARFTPVAEPAF